MANSYANQLLTLAAANNDADVAKIALDYGATNVAQALATAAGGDPDLVDVLTSYQRPKSTPWQSAVSEFSRQSGLRNAIQIGNILRPYWTDVVINRGLTWRDAVNAALAQYNQ